MGLFSDISSLFRQVLPGTGSQGGLPIGFGKNIVPLNIKTSNLLGGPSPISQLYDLAASNLLGGPRPASIAKPTEPTPSAVQEAPTLPAGNAGVPQGSNAPAASGKGPTDIIGGLGAPEQLPGGGYRVFDNRTGKYIYGGGATDPNAPATPRVTPAEPSPATPAAPAPPPVEAPSSQSIGSIVFPKRQMTPDGILASLMRVMGGALPQGPGTENAPTGFGRFLRSLAANRFIS